MLKTIILLADGGFGAPVNPEEIASKNILLFVLPRGRFGLLIFSI